MTTMYDNMTTTSAPLRELLNSHANSPCVNVLGIPVDELSKTDLVRLVKLMYHSRIKKTEYEIRNSLHVMRLKLRNAHTCDN